MFFWLFLGPSNFYFNFRLPNLIKKKNKKSNNIFTWKVCNIINREVKAEFQCTGIKDKLDCFKCFC